MGVGSFEGKVMSFSEVVQPDKIEIVSYIGMREDGEPAARTSGFKTIEDARRHGRKNYDSFQQQAVRISIKAGALSWTERIDPEDTRVLAPYSVCRIAFPSYFLAYKPTTIEQGLMRRAAAQGKPIVGMRAHHADYNGHHNSLTWNDYRGYYVGEYTWAGRNVWYRGTNFAEALACAKAEYAGQGAEAYLSVTPHTWQDEQLIKADSDFMLRTEEAEKQSYQDSITWKHAHISEIVDYMGGVNHRRMQALLDASTEEEYQATKGGPDMARMAQLSREFDEAIKQI